MAYNNGFPINYQSMYQPYNYVQQQPLTQPVIQPQVTQPVNDTGILWVQGEAGAKSWAVAPGKSVMLMDSESSTFYIKSSDNSGYSRAMDKQRMIGKLEDMMDDAPSEKERRALQQCVDKLEKQ